MPSGGYEVTHEKTREYMASKPATLASDGQEIALQGGLLLHGCRT